MKSIAVILLFASFLIAPRPSHAQLQVGMTGGLSMAKISVIGFEDLELGYQRGYAIGGVLDIFLSDYASIYVQPRYIQKGVDIDTDFPFFGNIDGRATISYFELPVALKFVYTEDTIQPYFYVGPSFGILRSSKFEGVANDQRINEDVDEVTGGFDVGLGGGGGVGFALGGTLIFVEGRYIIGYSDVMEDGTIVVNGQEQVIIGDVENRNFELMAGIKIQLGD